MIQFNPLYKQNGSANGALTTAPSASLVFDLPGKTIWAKGVKLKGTDHTYTFSHDNYITLTNTPGSNESEDIKIGVNIQTLKSAIDTTYSIVNSSTSGLVPAYSSLNKSTTSNSNTYYFLGIQGDTLKWFQNSYRPIKINSNQEVLDINSTDPLWLVQGIGINITWDSTNKKLTFTNTAADDNDKVAQYSTSTDAYYNLLFRFPTNNTSDINYSRFSEYLQFNPSQKILKINGNQVVTFANIFTGVASGIVPSSTSEQRNLFLKGDGTWATPTNTWRNIRINSDTSDILGTDINTGPLTIKSGNGINIIWDNTNKAITIVNTAPDVDHNTDTKVSQILNSNNKDYSLLLKHTDNSTNETDTVNYTSTLLYNPSIKQLKIDGNTVIHSGNITSNNPTLSWGQTNTIGSILGTNFNVTMPNDPITGWNIEVSKASFSITQQWEDSGIDLSTLQQGVCLLHINYQNVHYSGTFTYFGTNINTDDEILLHRSGYNSLNRGVIFAKIAPINGTTKLLLAGTTPETSISIFNIKIKQIAIL